MLNIGSDFSHSTTVYLSYHKFFKYNLFNAIFIMNSVYCIYICPH